MTLNKVSLIGYIGKDPIARAQANKSGALVTSLSLATHKDIRGVTKTQWHRIIFIDRENYKLGTLAYQYLKKGSKAYIEGELQYRKWDDHGTEKYITEIIADKLVFLDNKAKTSGVQSPQQAPTDSLSSKIEGGYFEQYN